ncbi:cysteine protease family C01A [Thraustotheca clavata]|uniref:Cysteine protease family C01A n=1 Tax=Thraustotheca clavata TaxID=74557 RepID=A0A1V9YN72_9STRA|nr:cysteine protease family C01A [Thraustotheca clavata]
MQLPTILATLFASTAALTITAEERISLTSELEQWEATFGEVAAKNGFYPPIHGLSEDAVTDLKLQRLKDSKDRVAQLIKANPNAAFSAQTQFGLLSADEFKAYVQKSFGKKQSLRKLRTDVDEAVDASLPASVDWTTSKCMPPVKDQGQCGSCWTFSATGAAEIGNCIAGGTLYNLAEQELVDCDTSDGNSGCDGGYEDKAINWIVAKGGLCLESDYPYTSGTSGKAGSCKTSCKVQKLPYVGNAVEIQGESALASALVNQVVTVSLYAGNDAFQYYTSGILSSCPSGQSDHAVIAVGYGSNYFKIRNSWGASWGESGYIRLSRGSGGQGTCNVAGAPAYPKLTSAGPTSQPTSAPTTAPTSKPSPTVAPTTKKPTPAPTTAAPSDSSSDSGSGSWWW